MTNKAMFAKSIRKKTCQSNRQVTFVALLMMLFSSTLVFGQEEEIIDRTGRLVKVSLPLTGSSSTSTIQQLREVASQMPAAVRAEDRAVLVLEFDTTDLNSGQGSDLGACVSLAEFLVGPELKSVRTVAWIPASGEQTALVGHAVLAAISCNEIAMDENASIGNAGIDLDAVPTYVQDIYEGIAKQRLTLPVPLVLGMLQPGNQIERVITNTQTVFATRSEREKMQAAGDVTEFRTISAAGEAALLNSQEMEEFRLIRYRTSSRADLARRFNVSTVELMPATENSQKWNAVQYVIPSLIDSSEVSWLIRSVDRKVLGKANMVILEFGDVRGRDNASLRLAEYLADFDRSEVKTVAWVSGKCEGIAGAAALACDDIHFGPNGTLGGGEQEVPSPAELESYEITVRSVAEQKDRDWSLLMGVVNPNMVVKKYRNADSNALRLMGKAEFDELPKLEAAKWFAVEQIEISNGIQFQLAKDMDVAQTNMAPTMDAVQSQYLLESQPESLEPTSTERLLEDFALFLNNPLISMILVFGAFTCFMNELSAPGLGVFGFLGVLLLTAFFWSHYLEGSAAWFEILMFVIGLIFIGIELFVIPGFGLFGIGGIAMIICSLVLAGQDFVIPKSDADFEKMSLSLLPILGAFFGIVVGAIVLQKVLPNSPIFKRLALSPPKPRETLLDGGDPEAVVDWAFLNGLKGEAVTEIMPSGKARIDGRVYDVITRGQVVKKGESVEVVEAIANRVVVKKI